MKKVALRRAEYMATLPPYRFNPGDVIEIDDDWADQLVRRNIANKASANAETVTDKRRAAQDERDAVTGARAREERDARRAALYAEMDALDQQDAAAQQASAGGHYGDMITREEAAPEADTPSRGRRAQATADAESGKDTGDSSRAR